jgi:hypothetical protein
MKRLTLVIGATVGALLSPAVALSCPPAQSGLESVAQTASSAAPVLSGTRLGGLDWGRRSVEELRLAQPTDPARRAVDASLRDAQLELDRDAKIYAVPVLHIDGVMPTSRDYKLTDAALKTLPIVANWALCARVASDPLASRCQAAARRGLLRWMETYTAPSGNPIDEHDLTPLIKSIDLMLPTLNHEEQSAAKLWLRKLVMAEDRWAAQGGSRRSDAESLRLELRAMATRVLGDRAGQAETARLMHEQIARDLADDGSSLEFHRRDSLRYHVFDLWSFVEAAAFAPESVSAEDRARVVHALEFLKPYFLGEKQHTEFTASQDAFDARRRAAGLSEFQLAPWDPANARKLLRVARSVFPEIASWTTSVAGDESGNATQLSATLHGN